MREGGENLQPLDVVSRATGRVKLFLFLWEGAAPAHSSSGPGAREGATLLPT